MTAKLLDGKQIASEIRGELTRDVAAFVERCGIRPTLVAILVGDFAPSEVYVRNKERACQQVGIRSQVHRRGPETSEPDLLHLIEQLNQDRDVHGILVQLPLPRQIRESRVLDAIAPLKDVDAFHPENVGLIAQGRPRYLPCTPHGISQLLHRAGIKTRGKHAVIVGRSDIVGKPMSLMLMNRNSSVGPDGANATVTVCHTQTADLASVTRRADLLIAAIGRPKFITAEMVKPGAVVVDVGINRIASGLVGDVDFEAVKEVAGYLTPVPGGVGPLTVTMLLYNTLEAARRQIGDAADSAALRDAG
ncbi:MAG: bifunctional methylenetetrahydrofolate dehydrogenase/methenyltetrahydrofolate cyclohydrolase FolD [Candidatus Anammoximicrobium sp.]|nr:bifunctional methylenetetrahydrofolate dehydrogenase/methenyltetrahydrofolate cyclohydrolase FolD [Candidatus Anammoximicrobium sp.]